MIRTSLIVALPQSRRCHACGGKIPRFHSAVLVSGKAPRHHIHPTCPLQVRVMGSDRLYPADTTAVAIRFDVAWAEAGL